MYKYHILISIINKSPVKLTIIVYLAIKLGIIAAVGLFTDGLGSLEKVRLSQITLHPHSL